MKTKHYWSYIGVASLMLLVGLSKSGAAASANQAITLTPTSVSETVQPAQVKNGSFEILNQGKTTYDFKIYAAPYHVSGEEYTPDFSPLHGAPDVASWFQFSLSHAHLKPGQSAKVDYRLSIPNDVLPGGYYAVAFAETSYPKQDISIVLNARVGEIFYLRVAGPAKQAGRVASWQAPFWQKSPLTSVLRLENSGSVHYAADTTITVRDLLGHAKYTLKTEKVILPQTVRKIEAPWKNGASFGLFKVDGTVDLLGHKTQLPARYVLVMSPMVRVVALVLLLIGVLLLGLRYKKRPATIRHGAKKNS